MVPVEKAILLVLGVEVLIAGCLPVVYFISLRNESSRSDRRADPTDSRTGGS